MIWYLVLTWRWRWHANVDVEAEALRQDLMQESQLEIYYLNRSEYLNLLAALFGGP